MYASRYSINYSKRHLVHARRPVRGQRHALAHVGGDEVRLDQKGGRRHSSLLTVAAVHEHAQVPDQDRPGGHGQNVGFVRRTCAPTR